MRSSNALGRLGFRALAFLESLFLSNAVCFGQAMGAGGLPPPVRKVFEKSVVEVALIEPIVYETDGKLSIEYKVLNAGTGFFVADGVALTCLHVIEGILLADEGALPKRIYIWHLDGKYEAKLLAYNREKDTALLRVFIPPRMSVESLVFAKTKGETGVFVYSIRRAERSLGKTVLITKHVLSSPIGVVSPRIAAGVSGSPVVSAEGECLGMFHSFYTDAGLFLPAAEIVKFLKEEGIEARLGK